TRIQGAGMFDSFWDRLLAAVEAGNPGGSLESWLKTCHLIAVDSDHIRIAAPNKYTRDWLVHNHAAYLESASRKILGGSPRVSFEIERDAPAAGPTPRAPREPFVPATPTGLSARYTFDTFVVGNSNQFAQAACHAVAELPSKAYNPLFIYG